ncbi:hypothetical protein A2U01_0082321, partial [Trifolium medium]|nr:hypothetical protein [Trifolium medium]
MKSSKTVAECATTAAGCAFQISALISLAALGFESEERTRMR